MHDPHQNTPMAGAPGFNKQLRDRSKYALALTALLMVAGKLHWACISSAYSVFNLKAGTSISSKNAKWMLLSIISFCVCLSCTVLDGGARLIDENRDYSFQARLRFWSFALKTFWWPVLTMFLVSSWGYATSEKGQMRNEALATNVQKKFS
jgi:hypothetical protein